MSLCHLCETKKPRRFCPGVRAEICSLCCGTEREQTVDCPLDCEYLREARMHEKVPEVSSEEFPNRDVKLTDDFIRENEPLIAFLAQAVLGASLETQGAVDSDIREALAAMIKTMRTRESGLIYDTRPANPYAAAIQSRTGSELEAFRERVAQEVGVHTIRDAQVLGVLVFLESLAIQHDNRRRRGKAFLDFLYRYFSASAAGPAAVQSQA